MPQKLSRSTTDTLYDWRSAQATTRGPRHRSAVRRSATGPCVLGRLQSIGAQHRFEQRRRDPLLPGSDGPCRGFDHEGRHLSRDHGPPSCHGAQARAGKLWFWRRTRFLRTTALQTRGASAIAPCLQLQSERPSAGTLTKHSSSIVAKSVREDGDRSEAPCSREWHRRTRETGAGIRPTSPQRTESGEKPWTRITFSVTKDRNRQ